MTKSSSSMWSLDITEIWAQLPASKTWGLNIFMLLSALGAPETFEARRPLLWALE